MSKPNKIFYEKPRHLQEQQKANKKIEEHYFAPSYKPQDYSAGSKEKAGIGSKVKSWIANGALVVLSIILVVLLAVAVGQVSDWNRVWDRDERDFWYNISDGYYSDMVASSYHNRNNGVVTTSGLQECYAIAEYFEAASLYKAAVQVGDIEDIQKYQAKMEECLNYLDDVLYVIEDINMKLGIE